MPLYIKSTSGLRLKLNTHFQSNLERNESNEKPLENVQGFMDDGHENTGDNFMVNAVTPNTSENSTNPNKIEPSSGTNTQATISTGEGEDELVIDPENFLHHLQNPWTLWYLENDRTKTWEEMQNEITTFDTVEDFWKLYSHIKAPSDLRPGCDYSLFKKGVRPMWEDAANKEGGRWVITLNKNSKTDLDNLWLDVMLCLIGETFEHADEICGAVVNIRSKNNKISIWTANGSNEKAVLEIGYKLRDTLHLGCQNLQYQLHKDTMVKQGSIVKSAYVL